jgi:tetratricopeptide (TPR) repeat protein
MSSNNVSIIPIQQAIMQNNFDMVKVLLESGSQDINAQSILGSALHILAVMPRVDFQIFDLLLSHGANVNAVDLNGNTPIHIAGLHNPVTDVIIALLKNGANIDMPNAEGYTALEYLKIRSDWHRIQKEGSDYIRISSNTEIQSKKPTDNKMAVEVFLKKVWEAMNYCTTGLRYFEQDSYIECIKECMKGLQCYPHKESDNISDIPGHARVFFASAHNNIGAAYARMQQWQQALREYEKVLFYSPDDPESLNNIGACHNELGNIEESIKCREKALFFNPSYAEAHVNLGNSYLQKREYAKAIPEYTEAINIKQKHGQGYTIAYFNRAVCYNNLGMSEDAIADYNFVKQYDFDNEFTEVYQRQGLLYALQGDHKKAIEDFTQMITLAKNNQQKAVAYNSRAISWAVLGNIQQAFNDFNTAIKLYPGYNEPIYNQEILLKKMRNIF